MFASYLFTIVVGFMFRVHLYVFFGATELLFIHFKTTCIELQLLNRPILAGICFENSLLLYLMAKCKPTKMNYISVRCIFNQVYKQKLTFLSPVLILTISLRDTNAFGSVFLFWCTDLILCAYSHELNISLCFLFYLSLGFGNVRVVRTVAAASVNIHGRNISLIFLWW